VPCNIQVKAPSPAAGREPQTKRRANVQAHSRVPDTQVAVGPTARQEPTRRQEPTWRQETLRVFTGNPLAQK
jgi:hypothetical protein